MFDPVDEGPRSPWRTYQLCVQRGLELGESFLILQEDTIICNNFLQGVEQAAQARPDNPLAFFVPGKPPAYTNAIFRARSSGETWAELPLGTWVPVVALLWPRHLAERLQSWIEQTRFPPAWRADDEIIGRFLYEAHAPILASVPSLVEHPDSEPSVMNGHKRVGDGRDPGRRAFYFIGDEPKFECDATRIDWATP